MAVILCYGDSNTHGTPPLATLQDSDRFGPGARWPDVLAETLGAEHQIIAEGLPGRTTVHEDLIEGGARNGLSVLPAVLHSHKPLDLVILMLGTNDLKIRFSVTAWEISRAIARLGLLVEAELPGTDVMLVSPVPVQETGSLAEVFAGAEARQTGLTEHVAALAHAQGWGFVDAGAHVTVSSMDGVHWDKAAHLAFGAEMAKAVAARLAERSAPG